jgi:Rieske Fe-S protein
VREGLHKIAAYRDDEGALHRHSAICPHLGCVVEWNSAEKTWDCPCHGSRFDKLDGHVLNGPAIGALKHLSDDTEPPRPGSVERQRDRPLGTREPR